MNWQAMSFDWNQVRAFLATAEEGSFSGAARALKTTQPTIGRQISALEGALGITLVERSVRGLTLTQGGRDLLDHVRAMGEAATLISMVAAGQSQEVTGEVTVTATDLMSAAILPAILATLRQAAPSIRVRVVCSNDIQNLMQREADIAIRHVRPDQPEDQGGFRHARARIGRKGPGAVGAGRWRPSQTLAPVVGVVCGALPDSNPVSKRGGVPRHPPMGDTT